MCSINGTCGCKGTGLGAFLAALSWQTLLWLAKAIVQALQLMAVALILTTKWAAPRGWRLAQRGYRAGRQRWLTRPVLLDREPAAQVTATTTAPTLADLMQKQEANA